MGKPLPIRSMAALRRGVCRGRREEGSDSSRCARALPEERGEEGGGENM